MKLKEIKMRLERNRKESSKLIAEKKLLLGFAKKHCPYQIGDTCESNEPMSSGQLFTVETIDVDWVLGEAVGSSSLSFQVWGWISKQNSTAGSRYCSEGK